MKKVICILLLALAAFAVLFPAFAESYAQDGAIDLTPVINAGISLLGEILIAAIAVCVLPPLKRWLVEHATKSQQDKLVALIRELVMAAEQIFMQKGMGGQKLDWVRQELCERGYNVDQALIEAEVHRMNMGLLQAFEGIMETEPHDAAAE